MVHRCQWQGVLNTSYVLLQLHWNTSFEEACSYKYQVVEIPVAPVAYQVVLEPGIVYRSVSFVSSRPPECILVWIRGDLFLLCTIRLAESARAWVGNTRWKIDEQWDCWTLCWCAMKIEGKNRGGKRDDTCDHGLSRSWKVEVCKNWIIINK